MMSVKEQKKALRTEMKKRAENFTSDYRKRASEDICKQVTESSEFQQSEKVFLFAGAFGEPDTSEIISYALKRGKTVALPLCFKGGIMEARIITSMNELEPGMFGIMEPPKDSKVMEPSDIEFVLMPCVAASLAGERLGHGMGYYDRFLEGSAAYKLMVCPDLFLQEEIPVEEFDLKADCVITNRK